MIEIETLSREHDELAELASGLLDCVAREVPDLAEIGRLRWSMSRKLAAHLAKEDQLLYPRLRASADPKLAALAQLFADEMGSLGSVFRAYITGWSADRIANGWADFGIETVAVMTALRRRIAGEEGELYPALARA